MRMGLKQYEMYEAFFNRCDIPVVKGKPINCGQLHTFLFDVLKFNEKDMRSFVLKNPKIKKAVISFFTSSEFTEPLTCPILSGLMCDCGYILLSKELKCEQRKKIATLIKEKYIIDQLEFEF